MNKNLIIGVVVLVLVGGTYLYVTSQNKKPAITPQATQDMQPTVQMSPTQSMEEKTETMTPGASSENVKTIALTAGNFAFNLKEIKVKKGDTVKLTLTNTEGFHDWVLDEFNAKTKQLKEGESDTIQFTADKVGTFEYYCSVGQHRQMGMVGKFIVE